MKVFYNKNSDSNSFDLSLDESFAKNHNWNYGVFEVEDFDFKNNGLKEENGVVKVFQKQQSSRIVSKKLRIKSIVDSSISNIKDFDFTLLSELTKESPLYEKGRKMKSTYTHDGVLYVEKIFEDVNVGEELDSLKMTINWFNDDGSIGLVKKQTIKKFNKAEVKTFLRKRRQRAIDYLEASAEQKGFGWVIDLILTNFKTELELFILSGNSIFKDVIVAETTNENSKVVDLPDGSKATLSAILNSKLPPTELYPEGQTVAEGIIEEIN